MPDTSLVQLQPAVPFSQSMVWALVARYFRERGVAAWRDDEVPHYVTTNPFIGAAYAEVVFSAWSDLRRMGRWPDAGGQPLHICELGAGTGRLAFHFLRRLGELAAEAGLGQRTFRYVLTDTAEANLQFWESHPSLQRYFHSGILDCARFDAARDDSLVLRRSRQALATGGLGLPMVAIANYVFDGLPQDLLHFDGGQASQCHTSLWTAEPAPQDAGDLLGALQYRFERRSLATDAYPEPWLSRLVEGYRKALVGTHLLLPTSALRCLHRLRALSPAGLLLLTADKGTHHLAELRGRGLPYVAYNGSISLDVNYHAIKAYCENEGGQAWFPRAHHASLNVGACLIAADAAHWHETRHACERHLHTFGPDDFYVVTRHVHETLATLQTRDILAYLRLSRHDPHQCARYLPRLLDLAPGFSAQDRESVAAALEASWAAYYPLGEEADFASCMGEVFLAMGDAERALAAFMRSAQLYGHRADTVVAMAVCHCMADRLPAARQLLGALLEREPGHGNALALQARLDAQPAVAA